MGDGLFPLAAPGERSMDHPLDSERLDIPRLIKEYGLKPDKGLGQNFLLDPHYLSRVADAGEISDQFSGFPGTTGRRGRNRCRSDPGFN